LRREEIDNVSDPAPEAVDRSIALRRSALSLEKAFSIGLKSGL
jgi:hypothetical protein